MTSSCDQASGSAPRCEQSSIKTDSAGSQRACPRGGVTAPPRGGVRGVPLLGGVGETPAPPMGGVRGTARPVGGVALRKRSVLRPPRSLHRAESASLMCNPMPRFSMSTSHTTPAQNDPAQHLPHSLAPREYSSHSWDPPKPAILRISLHIFLPL